MDKTVKWILIALLIIVVLAIIIFAIKYFMDQSAANNNQPSPGGPPSPGNGIIDALSGLFSGDFFSNLFGGKKCDPARPGFQKNGVYNPDKCGRAPGLECDPNRPGWNLGGFMDPSC